MAGYLKGLQRTKFNFSPEIGTSDRILVAGAPRDGKTRFALGLLAKINPPRTVILNPSPDQVYFDLFGQPSYNVDTSFPQVQHVAPLYQRDKKKYDAQYWPIVQEGNVYTLMDEWSAVSTENRYGDGLTYFVQMGRRRNCGHIGLTQKLHRIPTFLIDLADHIFVGGVQGADLDRLERETKQNWAPLLSTRAPYQFIYWSKNGPEPPRYIN